ncbi:MAG TPA: PIG-L family deacetylase [Candidatus Sulfotelmatobacter sp.]|nr:PIG-L family deacetylase [Candidatus Sulfotelmatobacter sp.]
MDRRDLFKGALATGLLRNPPLSAQTTPTTDVVIERAVSGKPHTGKVLALITPHLDDGPFFASGTVTKLLNEGYTGVFIRTSNDEKDSYDLTLGETVLANEQDARSFLTVSGLKQMFDLSYRNHRMDDLARTEIRARLIFLFRLLRIDTVFSYDPWGHYEENPDHYVTAQAVEAACWMAGGHLDMPEHFAAGLKPHSVSEKYYFARGPQLVNRVVDIGATFETKLGCLRACRTMITHMIKDLNASLLERKLHMPALSAADNDAINEFTKVALETKDRATGQKFGLDYAEAFHYIGPDRSMDDYIARHTAPL